MKNSLIVQDTGKSFVFALVSEEEELFRRVFDYKEGENKPLVYNNFISAFESFLRNTEFFVRH